MLRKLFWTSTKSAQAKRIAPLIPRTHEQELIRFCRNARTSIVSIWAVKRVQEVLIKREHETGCDPYYYIELLSGVLLKLNAEDFKGTSPNNPIDVQSQEIVSTLARIDEMVSNKDLRLWWFSRYSDFIYERYGVKIHTSHGSDIDNVCYPRLGQQ
jgi:hypothetical protein